MSSYRKILLNRVLIFVVIVAGCWIATPRFGEEATVGMHLSFLDGLRERMAVPTSIVEAQQIPDYYRIVSRDFWRERVSDPLNPWLTQEEVQIEVHVASGQEDYDSILYFFPDRRNLVKLYEDANILAVQWLLPDDNDHADRLELCRRFVEDWVITSGVDNETGETWNIDFNWPEVLGQNMWLSSNASRRVGLTSRWHERVDIFISDTSATLYTYKRSDVRVGFVRSDSWFSDDFEAQLNR